MDHYQESEEPFGFDGRSLEEQLASLDSMNSRPLDPEQPAAGSDRAPDSGDGDAPPAWNETRPYELSSQIGDASSAPREDENGSWSYQPSGRQEHPDEAGSHTWAPEQQRSSPQDEATGWAQDDTGEWSGQQPPSWPGDPGWGQQWQGAYREPEEPWSAAEPAYDLQYGQPPYGQPPYGQPPYDQPPYDQLPYDQSQAPQRDSSHIYPAAKEPDYTQHQAAARPAPEPQTSESLRPETLLRGRRRAPANGWRRAVYRMSGGMIHPGESPAELRRRQLIARGRTVVAGGHHRVAVLSLKGGVGKTTTTIGLGSTLAALRGDRVAAIDANPDRGTLSDKLHLETAATVRDLLNERENVRRYADVRAFTSQAPSRLEVLASDRDPAVSEAFSEEDFRAVARVLEHFYSICITDCGTGLLHSAMSGVLRLANQIVLVSSPSVDGARSASATLDWLEAHEFSELVRAATVVLSGVRESSKSSIDLGRLEQHFASRCNAVVRIPYDPHLEEGAEVELDCLKLATREAYLSLAATVGDGLGHRRGVPVTPPTRDGWSG